MRQIALGQGQTGDYDISYMFVQKHRHVVGFYVRFKFFSAQLQTV